MSARKWAGLGRSRSEAAFTFATFVAPQARLHPIRSEEQSAVVRIKIDRMVEPPRSWTLSWRKRFPPHDLSPAHGARQTRVDSISVEAEPRAEAEDARAQDLEHVVGALAGQHALPLQDVGRVEGVEDVHSQRQAEVAEIHFLLHSQVEDVDVGIAEGVGARLDGDVDARARVVGDRLAEDA